MIASLILVNTASAITTYAEWQNQQSTITINQGDQVYFDYSLFSVNPPMTYSVRLYDNSYNIIRTYADTTTNNNFVSERQYVTSNDYQNPGSYRVIVQGRDALNDQSSSTINLIVNPVGGGNNPPVLNPIGNKQINEGQLLQFTVTAQDPNNDPIILSATNLPTNAIFQDSGLGVSLFIWLTDFDDAGTYNVIFTANDGQLTDSETITITVNNIPSNNIPVILITRPLPNEVISGVYNVTWTAFDLDQPDNTLDIKLEYTYDGYTWFILEDGQDNNDGIFTLDTRRLSDANDYSLRATVRDDQSNTNFAQVNFIVDNLFAPNVNFIRPQENEVIFGIYNILWNATDVDQPANTLDIKLEYRGKNHTNLFRIVLSLFTSQNWVTLEDGQDNNDGIFTWDTTRVSNGDYELRAIATDNSQLTGTAYINTVTINNRILVNRNPIITSMPVTTATVNQVYYYDVDAIDPDNDPITYSLSTLSPRGMIINPNTGLITWTPDATQLGDNDVIVLAQDNRGGLARQLFTITVTQGQILPTKISHIHSFTINNVILKQSENKLNVYSYIKNSGNQDERINVRATIMQNGMQKIIAFNLDKNHNEYVTLTFDNLKKGFYIVKVEAFNSNNYEVRYAYVNV